MKKNVLILIAILSSITNQAYNFEVDGIYYDFIYQNNKQCVSVTCRDKQEIFDNYGSNIKTYTGDIVLPESVKFNNTEYAVIAIGDFAFSGCKSLTSISIPNTVTRIGRGAFSECSSLKALYIPSSVTAMDVSVFSPEMNNKRIIGNIISGCTSLSVIKVDKDNPVFDSRDDCNAIINTNHNIMFLGCKTTKIPNNILGIDNYTFCCCSGLSSITIPYSVTNIDLFSFYGCTNLSSIKVEEGNLKFDSRNNCNAIIESSSSTLFIGCKATKIPNNVTSIGTSAFEGCTGISSITIPNNIETIGNSAFRDCINLNTIIIPNSVETIGNSAFYGCINLNTITIPNSVKNIRAGAFYFCNILGVFVKGSTPPQMENAFSPQSYTHALLYVPADEWFTYAYDNSWYQFINIRETAITEEQISEHMAYTLMNINTFEYSVYDPVNDCVGTINSVSGINEDNPYHNWQILEAGGFHYLYNIGAKKFAKRGSGGLELTSNPSPIEIENGGDGIILGGQKSQQWAFVSNEKMVNNKAIITCITPLSSSLKGNNCNYDLSGRLQKQAQRGINIINGRKIIVR